MTLARSWSAGRPARTRFGAAVTISTAWGAILAALLLLGWLLTHGGESSVGRWDDDVERWLAARRTGDLDRVAAAGTFLGNVWVTLAVAAVVAVVVSVARRSPRPAVFLAVVVSGALGLYVVATHLVTRYRPPVPILDRGLVPDHSFPSGHVIAAVVVYGGSALLLARAVPRARRWLSLVLLVTILVALARLYQGAHHPTDVLTSLVFATAWVAVVDRVLWWCGRAGL